MSQTRLPRYIVISPTKDEERYMEKTFCSMLSQTVRPLRWIIVDDGSRDATPEIIRRCAEGQEWIQVLTMKRDATRLPGSGVIRAFAAGYERIASEEFDLVVKMDCDVDLPKDYFEKLIQKFEDDENLGIASGVYTELVRDRWVPVPMPSYHAAGASKMMRKRCYEAIGGFIPSRGWDTVDEIRAQFRGWKTRHFPDLEFRHLKREGVGIGNLRTNAMHGEIYYLTGGGILFFALKTAHRAFVGRPVILAGLAVLWGYLKCWATGRQKLVSEPEARSYRQLLNHRLRGGVAKILGRTSTDKEAWV